MFLVKSFFLSKLFLQLNFYFLVLLVCVSIIIFYLSKIFNVHNLYKNSTSLKILRLILVLGLLLSFFFHCFVMWLYVNLVYNFVSYSVIDTFLLIPNINYFMSIKLFNIFNFEIFNIYMSMDFFGLILLMLAYVVGFISILALDTRLFWKNIKYLFSFNVFALIVYFYVSVSNIIVFFLAYEFLLIPSFFFVYYVSPSRRAIQASLYFIIWTQVG